MGGSFARTLCPLVNSFRDPYASTHPMSHILVGGDAEQALATREHETERRRSQADTAAVTGEIKSEA